MPITLDPDLDPALFPLAWILGRWRGEGAVELPLEEGAPADAPTGRRIEQELEVAPLTEGTAGWAMRTWVLDAPPPVPPTAAFGDQEAPAPAPESADGEEPERRLLVEETGYLKVLGPVPGQDLAAAQAAKPGSPESVVTYGLRAAITASDDTVEVSAGEVSGPRIRLASDLLSTAEGTTFRASRLFGLVGGRLFWLLERAEGEGELAPYLSVELDRA